jgi:hypothetical protein
VFDPFFLFVRLTELWFNHDRPRTPNEAKPLRRNELSRHKTHSIHSTRCGTELGCLFLAADQRAPAFARRPVEFGYSRYLFHDPFALDASTLPDFRPIASDCRAIQSQTHYERVFKMNNRNQQQPNRPAPAAAPVQAQLPALTYFNVFTVEEYESNGKAGKRWTKIGAAFPHKGRHGLQCRTEGLPHRRSPRRSSSRSRRQQQITKFQTTSGARMGPFFLRRRASMRIRCSIVTYLSGGSILVFRSVKNRRFSPQPPWVERMRSTGDQGLVTQGLRDAGPDNK